MIGTLFQADLEELIAAQDWNGLREAILDLDPSDIAEIIIDLPPSEEGVIFRVLPRELAAQVFSYLPLAQQEELIGSISNEQSRQLLEQMKSDDRVRLLEEMPAEVTRRLLESLTPEQLKATRFILNYPEGTAGRYMTREYASLKPGMTAGDALEHIRKTGRGKETLSVIYIVDDQGVLLDDIRLGSLVMAEPGTKITDLQDRTLVSIPVSADRAGMVAAFEKYDRLALPVVDGGGHMLGIITADDVLDAAEEIATEEIQKMGGTEALDAPYLTVGFWSMVKKRGGWLAVLFLGEMLTATAMGYFESEIERAAVVALFVPLIISSGGNSGSQGTSLIIRSLALKEIRLRDWWRVFGRELRTGLTLGLFLGFLGFCRIGAWQFLSTVPAVGTFFQTHSEQDLAAVPEGFKLVTGDTKVEVPVHIPEHTLPAGTEIQKGQLLPVATVLPDKFPAAALDAHRPAPTAYGQHWLLVGLTVFASLIGVITWGSLAGSMLPFILRRLGFDPATSSAPFVATLVDVTGLIIYFLVAKIILTGTLL